MKILGVAMKLDLARKNVSSTIGFVANHLKARGVVTNVVEADLPNPVLKYFLLKNFSFNKDVWAIQSALDVGKRKLRTRLLAPRLREVAQETDLVVQVGSEFSVPETGIAGDKPVFSYHDDNVYRYFMSRTASMGQALVSKLEPGFKETVQYEKKVYDELSGMLCMTEYLRSIFIERLGVDARKVHCIGFGANHAIPKKSSIGRDYSKPSIMFIAKDSFKEKGGEILLSAFRMVRGRFKDATLTIVGQKHDYDMDGVRWAGYLDKRNPDQKKVFNSVFMDSSLFVMPSFVEAAGGAFLEAMSYGLPCIGANQGSTPEIIVGHDAGLVLDKPDPKELADKIIALFEAPAELERMGANARKAVDEYYNWDAVCDRAEAIFRAALQ